MTRAQVNDRLNALMATSGIDYLRNRQSIAPVVLRLTSTGWVRSGVLPRVIFTRRYTYTITRDPDRQARLESSGEAVSGQNAYTSTMTEKTSVTIGVAGKETIASADEWESIGRCAIWALPRPQRVITPEREAIS